MRILENVGVPKITLSLEEIEKARKAYEEERTQSPSLRAVVRQVRDVYQRNL